mgnify:FL=1
MQDRYYFLYDLYAECIQIPEMLIIAQSDIYAEAERRVLCELLITSAQDDAPHLSDDDVRLIHRLAVVRANQFADEERAHWEKLKLACLDEMEERKERELEEYLCPNCGGDVRSGDHNIQVDVDDFICHPDLMDYADYLYELHGDR